MASQLAHVNAPEQTVETRLGRQHPRRPLSWLAVAGLLVFLGALAIVQRTFHDVATPSSGTTAIPVDASPTTVPPPAASPESLVLLAEEADALAREQMRLTHALQDALSRYQAGSGGRLPGSVGTSLTPDQRELLAERLKSKRMGTASVLQDLLTRDQQLSEVTARLQELNTQLPFSATAVEGQRHERLAMDYLHRQGLSTDAAYTLVSKASLQEPLIGGFRVFLHYRNGEFATWVTQGEAPVSPKRLRDQLAELATAERDAAVSALEAAKADRDDLRNLVSAADHALQATRADLKTMAQAAEREQARGSDVRYVVGSKSELQNNKVVDKSLRLLPARVPGNPLSGAVPVSLPPIDPSAYGLRKVKRVSIVPGTVVEGDDYRVSNVDGFLSIEIMRPEQFAQYAKYFVVVLE